MNIIHLIVVLATVLSANAYIAYSYDNDWELLLQARAAAKLNSNCDWTTYQPDGTGKTYTDPKSYPCSSITLVGGYCILPWSQAISVCNSDPNCGGISLTTNNNWHNSYDKNNEPSVHLYGVSSPIAASTSGEWYMLFKKCWKFNT